MGKTVLIYNEGPQYETYVEIKEFNSPEEMIEFINNEGIGTAFKAAYEFYEKIEIQAFEKVVKYKLKE